MRLREIADERLNLGFDVRWARDVLTPWIHLALVPDPAHRMKSSPTTFERFREIVLSATQDSIDPPDVYPSAIGYVARNHSSQEVRHTVQPSRSNTGTAERSMSPCRCRLARSLAATCQVF